MIFLILLLALSVNASEIDINYKWYKYTESSYMNYDEIKLLENVYVDYSDYQIDEYFNVKDYEELKGRYIYIYNKSGKRVEFESINILYNGKAINYRSLVQLGDDKPIALSTKGKVMFDLKNAYYLKDLELEIVYSGGNIDVCLSRQGQFKDNRLAYEEIKESGNYKLYHLRDKKEILYKTYYNPEYGEYRKEGYDDYIYKDVNDYKIYYFFYKNIINDKNIKVEDLLDTNYTLKSIEGNIDYSVDGKYKIKLIFEECVKEIEVIVSISDDSKVKKLEMKIEELNDLIIKYKEEIDSLESLKNENREEIKKLEIKIEELNNLIIKYKEEIDSLESLKKENDDKIKKLEMKIEELNNLIIKYKEEIEGLKKLKNENDDKIKRLEKELESNSNEKLKEKLESIKRDKNEEILKLKEKIKKIKDDNKNKISDLNDKLNKCKMDNNERINKLKEELKIKEKEYEKCKLELNDNKNIYEKNKNNYKKIIELKNACFKELNRVVDIANSKSKELKSLKNRYDYEKDYNERYIKKLKYVIDEKDVDYWNTKKCSIFVGFKKIY